ncbi:hypothetical protein Tco_0283109 [Tanacetum coccineum]
MSSSPHSTIIPSDSDIKDAFSSMNTLNYFPASSGKIFPKSPKRISSPKDTETPVESPIPISPSSSVGSSSPVRSTTPPPDYLFDESIFAKLDNSLWIIPRPLGSKPVPEESNLSPKRTSTSAAPTMTQAAIRQLVADSVATALKVQTATMENTNNTNRNTGTSGTPVARKGTNDHKQKFDDRRNTTTNNDNNNHLNDHNNNNHSNNRNNNYYQDDSNNNNRNNDHHQQQIRRQETFRNYTASNRNCRSKGPATGSNLLSVSVTCHACGEKRHYKSQCSKTDNSTFHVSKKCLCDESLVIPMKEIWLDDKLNFVEEPVEIMDREVKKLRQRRIPIVKVRWNSEFSWEREDQIRAKYPHLFSNTTPSYK